MIDTFIKFLTYEKRASPYTITSYHNDLLQFHSFLSHHSPTIPIHLASHLEIRAWIVDLSNKKHKPRSINRKISTLRSFYKFLQYRDYINKNPTFKVKALKAHYPLPHFVQTEDLFDLLDQYEFTKDFAGYRDRLMIELLYGTGIRLSEMTYLKTGDVDEMNSTIKVHGKGNKERIVPFHRSLSKLLKRYKEERRSHFAEEKDRTPYLLITNKGTQCYPMMVYRTVRKYLDQFTSIDKRSPHVIRHTFATHLLENGADLNAIKDLLGHASLAATQIYTHNTVEKLKTVFDQAHPKA